VRRPIGCWLATASETHLQTEFWVWVWFRGLVELSFSLWLAPHLSASLAALNLLIVAVIASYQIPISTSVEYHHQCQEKSSFGVFMMIPRGVVDTALGASRG
jgi:hypothetical protein